MMQRLAVPLLIMALLVGVAAVILLLRDGGGVDATLVLQPEAGLISNG